MLVGGAKVVDGRVERHVVRRRAEAKTMLAGRCRRGVIACSDGLRPVLLEGPPGLQLIGRCSVALCPYLHLFCVDAASRNYTFRDVDDVAFSNGVEREHRILHASVDSLGEGFEAVAGAPVRCHAFPVGMGSVRRCTAILGQKILKTVAEDGVWVPQAALIVCRPVRGIDAIQKYIGEGCVHVNTVLIPFEFLCVGGCYSRPIIIVRAHGVIGDRANLGGERVHIGGVGGRRVLGVHFGGHDEVEEVHRP